MNEIHELDAAREELRRALPSDDARRAANRRALTAHMTVATDAKPGAANPTAAESPAAKPAARPPRVRRRWVPAVSLGAVAATACVAFAIVALQPSGNGGSSGGEQPARAPELRLAGAGNGALAALKLDQASAADVLRAAGESAAAGAPDADGAPWRFVEYTNGDSAFSEHGQQWRSSDGEHTYTLSETRGQDGSGRTVTGVMAHYIGMRSRALGTVTWSTAPDGAVSDRKAHWSTDAGAGEIDMQREEDIYDALRDATTADDVHASLEDALAITTVTYEHGMLCTDAGTCHSAQLELDDPSEAEVRERYLTSELVRALGTQVHGPETTRAMYELLARSTDAIVDRAASDADTVVIRLRSDGMSQKRWERLELDAASGRLVERRWYSFGPPTTIRWTSVGLATHPVTADHGICARFPEPCAELRALAEAHAADPAATFADVISQAEVEAEFRERAEQLREEATKIGPAEGARGG